MCVICVLNYMAKQMTALVDSTRYEFALHIESDIKDGVPTAADTVASINPNDMRMLAKKSSGAYTTD